MKVFSIRQLEGGIRARGESLGGDGSKLGGYASWRKLSMRYGSNSLQRWRKAFFLFEKSTIAFNQAMENRTVIVGSLDSLTSLRF